MSEATQAANLASGIASAPGDLPIAALMERHALKATQFRHDNTLSPSAPKPGQPVSVTATSGVVLGIERAEIWYTTDGTWPDEGSRRVPMTLADVEWTAGTRYLNHWQATLQPQPRGTVVRYKIVGYTASADGAPDLFAHDGSGLWFRYGEAGLTTFAYQVRALPSNLPDWMADAVVYHIFLDRFRNDAPDGHFPQGLDPQARHGGTLRGVLNALPYLADLGINCLWLSPLGPSATYHRYDQTDFFGVDADLGGIETLHQLVSAAHERGMRLILDFVPSHASWKMPEFLAAQQDQDAPTASWFVFDEWPDKYRCFMGMFPLLVSLNGNDDGLRQFLIDSAQYWLCDVGFDGLRLDHAIGHGTDFWIEFSTALEQAKPDVALFGEATDTPEMLRHFHGRLQGILDFPLAQLLRMSFGRGDWGVAELGTLQAHMHYMQEGPGRVTFFDNHDMNRFLFVAGGDTRRLKLAALCLFTLPLTPVLYYGTEIGLSQNRDKDAVGHGGDHEVRQDMIWDPAQWDRDLLAFFKAIIGLRGRQPVLRRGQWVPLYSNVEWQLYGYKIVSDSAEVQVLFNLSNERHQIQLDTSQPVQILLSTSPENVLEGKEAARLLTLERLSGVVLDSS